MDYFLTQERCEMAEERVVAISFEGIELMPNKHWYASKRHVQ
jgi:hypothetical protein